MDKFWQLLEQSVLVSGTIALAFSMVILYQWVQQIPVPDAEAAMFGAIISYFFRTRGEQQAAGMIKALAATQQALSEAQARKV